MFSCCLCCIIIVTMQSIKLNYLKRMNYLSPSSQHISVSNTTGGQTLLVWVCPTGWPPCGTVRTYVWWLLVVRSFCTTQLMESAGQRQLRQIRIGCLEEGISLGLRHVRHCGAIAEVVPVAKIGSNCHYISKLTYNTIFE